MLPLRPGGIVVCYLPVRVTPVSGGRSGGSPVWPRPSVTVSFPFSVSSSSGGSRAGTRGWASTSGVRGRVFTSFSGYTQVLIDKRNN